MVLDGQTTMKKARKITLIIKAHSEKGARNAASNRGIKLWDAYELEHCSYRAYTDAANIVEVQKWYLEPGECLPKIGYPTGTLLYFNVEN